MALSAYDLGLREEQAIVSRFVFVVLYQLHLKCIRIGYLVLIPNHVVIKFISLKFAFNWHCIMWILLAKPVLISVVSKSCGWFCIYTSLWSWDLRQCLE